jgi:hypothetical protein
VPLICRRVAPAQESSDRRVPHRRSAALSPSRSRRDAGCREGTPMGRLLGGGPIGCAQGHQSSCRFILCWTPASRGKGHETNLRRYQGHRTEPPPTFPRGVIPRHGVRPPTIALVGDRWTYGAASREGAERAQARACARRGPLRPRAPATARRDPRWWRDRGGPAQVADDLPLVGRLPGDGRRFGRWPTQPGGARR